MRPPRSPRPSGQPQAHSPASSAQSAASARSAAGGELVLIVTGSTIVAETRDRPLAYRLRERVLAWLDAREAVENPAKQSGESGATGRLEPVVCSDLWYLNARELAERPMIAIGEPGSNAATAVVSSRLPTAFVIEGSLRVHLDPEFIDLRAAIWGANAGATAAAIDLFAERYMSEFLGAA